MNPESTISWVIILIALSLASAVTSIIPILGPLIFIGVIFYLINNPYIHPTYRAFLSSLIVVMIISIVLAGIIIVLGGEIDANIFRLVSNNA